MRLMGASADMADAITSELEVCARSGLAAFVWCDGDDLHAVFADHGDAASDVQRLAAEVLGLPS